MDDDLEERDVIMYLAGSFSRRRQSPLEDAVYNGRSMPGHKGSGRCCPANHRQWALGLRETAHILLQLKVISSNHSVEKLL